MQERHLCWPPYSFPWPRSGPPSFFILESPLNRTIGVMGQTYETANQRKHCQNALQTGSGANVEKGLYKKCEWTTRLKITAYFIGVRYNGRDAIIRCVHEVPINDIQQLHVWSPDEHYFNLTRTKIWQGVVRANAACLGNCNESTVTGELAETDDLISSWLNQENDDAMQKGDAITRPPMNKLREQCVVYKHHRTREKSKRHTNIKSTLLICTYSCEKTWFDTSRILTKNKQTPMEKVRASTMNQRVN